MLSYRHEALLLLRDDPMLGTVVEVQLGADPDKRFVWPVYVANLRARLRCEVCLLVVAAEEAVARWACHGIELGGGSRIVPWVLGPTAVPQITNEQEARQAPELAVLSALAHGRAEILLHQLALRFGPVSPSLQASVRGANAEQLDEVAERVLTASTLEGALGPLL